MITVLKRALSVLFVLTAQLQKVNPLYPGPKQAGPDGERLRLKDPMLCDEALKYCTNCKRCEVLVRQM